MSFARAWMPRVRNPGGCFFSRHPEPVAHRAAVSKSLSRALARESRAANLSAA
jgi:hypothetical protein